MEYKKHSDFIPAVFIFFILLFAYVKLAGPIPFTVNNINTNKADSFQVQGEGKAAAAPDTAELTLGVTQTGSDVATIQASLNQKINKIIASLKEEGIEGKNIKTTDYSINPDFGTQGVSKNFTITQNLQIKAPIEKANKIIDLGVSNGANLAGGITFTLNDKKQEELENAARKEAVENAKKKANGLANAAGIKLGKIINVTENASSPQPVFLDSKQAQNTESTSTTLTPGQTNVDINVVLTYDTF